MVTQELLEYIRGELAKGLTRDEIHRTLISGGGWTEDDLSEAFSVPVPDVPVPEVAGSVEPERPALIPATSAAGSPTPILISAPISKTISSSHLSLWQDLIFIVIGLFCVFSWYFYQPSITGFWNNYINSSNEFSVNSWNKTEEFFSDFWNKSEELSVNSWNSYSDIFKKISFPALKLPTLHLPTFNFKFPSFNFKMPSFSLPSFNFKNIFGIGKAIPTPIANNSTMPPKTNEIKDCGTSLAPKLDTPTTSENNSVLACLGESAQNCQNAKGVLKDDFFPTVFEITQSAKQGSCNFKLSYPADSVLTDMTNKKLAGQYILCPIKIVKAIDNTKPATPKFIAPDKTNFSKYASQIYFYGTLGLFAENNLDLAKIQSLGCSGDYINSVIASYSIRK